MASLPLTPVDKYLRTIYEPDCDYVDGVVVDRNVGEYDHSTVQALLLRYLLESPDFGQIRIKPELRIEAQCEALPRSGFARHAENAKTRTSTHNTAYALHRDPLARGSNPSN